jgi:hypothetical protein
VYGSSGGVNNQKSTRNNNDINEFYGEIYLDNFRLTFGWDRKKKRCRSFTYRKAIDFLSEPGEFGLKKATIKRHQSARLTGAQNNNEIDLIYDLYTIETKKTTGDDLIKMLSGANLNQSLKIINPMKFELEKYFYFSSIFTIFCRF